MNQTATSPSTSTCPTIRQMILGPAILTLVITLLRLGAELAKLPSWLAGRDGGGNAALLGISWLPPLLGWWFARQIHGRTERPKTLLAKTLIAYGFAARIPVVLVTVLAERKGWDTHFNKFGPNPENGPTTFIGKIGAASFAQLVFWIFVWTLGSGMLVGWLTLRSRKRALAAG